MPDVQKKQLNNNFSSDRDYEKEAESIRKQLKRTPWEPPEDVNKYFPRLVNPLSEKIKRFKTALAIPEQEVKTRIDATMQVDDPRVAYAVGGRNEIYFPKNTQLNNREVLEVIPHEIQHLRGEKDYYSPDKKSDLMFGFSQDGVDNRALSDKISKYAKSNLDDKKDTEDVNLLQDLASEFPVYTALSGKLGTRRGSLLYKGDNPPVDPSESYEKIRKEVPESKKYWWNK